MWWRSLVAFVVAVWLAGLILFLRAPGTVTLTLPPRQPEPTDSHNLADWRHGPTIVASSYFRDPYSQHHPIFLVDRRDRPGPVEKWASAGPDRSPWVEIRWRQPRHLSMVVVRHAGAHEDAGYTVKRYKLSCILETGVGHSLDVKDNQAAVAKHPLDCVRAIGVRLDAMPNGDNDIVRVYEIEAWGA